MMHGNILVQEHFAVEDTLGDSRAVFPDDLWAEAKDRLLNPNRRRIRLVD
jgi:hypothetical protein